MRNATFVEVLADEALNNFGTMIVTLEEAALALFTDEKVWKGHIDSRSKELRAAMREVERATRGQAFRFDTPKGPLFVQIALWEFAGKSGICWGEAGPDRPAWRSMSARAAA